MFLDVLWVRTDADVIASTGHCPKWMRASFGRSSTPPPRRRSSAADYPPPTMILDDDAANLPLHEIKAVQRVRLVHLTRLSSVDFSNIATTSSIRLSSKQERVHVCTPRQHTIHHIFNTFSKARSPAIITLTTLKHSNGRDL